jgi:hypothetical protein
MKLKSIFLAAGLLATTLSAQAQIAYALDQCRQDFGEEFKLSNSSTHYFYAEGWRGISKSRKVSTRLDQSGGEEITWEPDEFGWLGWMNGRIVLQASEAMDGSLWVLRIHEQYDVPATIRGTYGVMSEKD